MISAITGGTFGALFPAGGSEALGDSDNVTSLQGGNGTVTCGWHSTCLDPWPDGYALDVGDPTYVDWRSNSSNSAGYSMAGNGKIAYYESGSCTHWTYVDVYDIGGYGSPNFRAEVLYEHVQSGYAGYTFAINSGLLEYPTTYYIGQTADEPLAPTCPFTGKHVHQQATGGGMDKNTTDYATASVCHTGCGSASFWVFHKTWVY